MRKKEGMGKRKKKRKKSKVATIMSHREVSLTFTTATRIYIFLFLRRDYLGFSLKLVIICSRFLFFPLRLLCSRGGKYIREFILVVLLFPPTPYSLCELAPVAAAAVAQ